MTEQTGALIERPEHEVAAEDLAARFSATADDLITRAFAVRQHFNHNVDENGVGIRVFSTNDTGSSGKGGDVLRVGDLSDTTSKPWEVFVVVRERAQLPWKEAGSEPLGPNPEIEETNGRLGSLTGAYEFAKYRHDPRISSDHVSPEYNWIDSRGGKPALRPRYDGNLETAAASTEAKLEAMRKLVEAAEARHAVASTTAKQEKALTRFKSWFRDRLPFNK